MPTPRTKRLLVGGLVVVFAAVVTLLAWRVVRDGESSDHSTTALGHLAAVLDRRQPTLEYLACRDRAELPFEAAQAEFILALYEQSILARAVPADPAAIAANARRIGTARRRYEATSRQLAAVTDPHASLSGPGPHRCPAIPLPPG